MSIYTKSKTSVSNLDVVKDFATDDSFKVGIAQGAENIIIDYLTNLYADPSTAVVRELFTNACDATGAEGTVTIQIEEVGEDTGVYKFTITDYGCGMSAKQLKENYVTYAASTKIADFDSVGSFGLGSKSPMAIVPSYTVISCNGEEQNKCTVARTGEGIFANLEKIENLGTSVSFTKVSFEGFGRSIAKKMDRYIRNVIIPFSKISVNYASIFTVNGYSDSPLLKNKSYEHSFKILRGAYEITLYADTAMDFYKMWGNRYVKHYARINNIVYPVSVSDDEKEATSAVVIDVEPGYFAFAPSREELPRGEKLDHIKGIVTSKLWDSYDDFIKWMIENKVVTAEEAYDYEKGRNLFAKINNANCFTGISQEKIDNANFLIQHRYNNCASDFDGVKGLHVYVYKNNSSIGYGPKTPQVFEEMPIRYLDDVLKECIKLVSKKSDNPYYKTVIKTTVVEGIKKGRKNGVIHIPAEFKKMAVGNRMLDEKRELYNAESPARHYDRFEHVYVFVEEGVEIPENIKKCLNYCSLNNKWEVLDAKYVTADYNMTASEGKTRRARVSVEDRNIKYYTSSAPYSDYECKLSELPGNIGSAKDTIIAYSDATNTHFVQLIASVTEKKVAVINDMTKGVYKYLTNLGYDIFNARPKMRSKYKRDCKDVVIDNYDMLDNPNEFTKKLIGTICDLGLSKWAYLYSGYFAGYQYLYNVEFDITKEMHAKIRYSLDSSFKEDCDNVKEYLASDYEDISSHNDKIVNIICANINDAVYHAYSERNKTISPIDIIDVDKFVEDNKEDIVKCKANSIISNKLRTIDPNYVVPRYAFAFEDEAINNMVKFIGSSNYYAIENKAFESGDTIIEEVKEALTELAENSDFKKYSPIYDDLEEGNELDMLIKAKVDEAISGMNKKLDSLC